MLADEHRFPQAGDEVHAVMRDPYGPSVGPWRVEAGRVSYVFNGPRHVCRVVLQRYRGLGHTGVPFVMGKYLFADVDEAFREAEALNAREMRRTPDAWLREPGVEESRP